MLTFFHLRRRSLTSTGNATAKDIRVISEIVMTPLISAVLGAGEEEPSTASSTGTSTVDGGGDDSRTTMRQSRKGSDTRVRK